MRAGRSSQVHFRPLQIVRQPTPNSVHHGKADVNEKAKAQSRVSEWMRRCLGIAKGGQTRLAKSLFDTLRLHEMSTLRWCAC